MIGLRQPPPSVEPGAPTASSGSAGLAAGLAAYLFAVTAVTLYSAEWTGLSAVPIFLTGLLCGAPAFSSLRARSFDPLEPIWLYTAIFFLQFFLKPVLTLRDPSRFGFAMLPLDYETMNVELSLFLAAGGLAAFYAGYYAVLRADRIQVPRFRVDWLSGRETVLFVAAAAAFFYAVNFFFSRAGYSFSAVYLNRAAIGGLSGELSFLVHLFGWLVVIIPFRRCLEGRSLGSRVSFLVMLAAVLAGFSVFGARWTLMFIPVSLLVLFHYRVRRLSVGMLSMAFSIVFLMSATFGAFRGEFDRDRLSPSGVVRNLADEMTAFADWDIFLCILEFYPKNRPHYRGRLAAEAGLWLLPRSIWPAKPALYGAGRIQDDLAPNLRILNAGGGYTGTSISQSTIGEGYADFGAAGAIGYMFLFGSAWAWFYLMLRRNDFSFQAAALYALIYVGLPIYIRGFSSPLVMVGLWIMLVCVTFRFLAGPHCARR